MKIIICLFLKLSVISSFDPTKVDYCSLKCDQQVSSACKCKKNSGHEEITDDVVTFRKAVVDEHNKFRNNIAGGSLQYEEKFPTAADMHVLNYDMELEHVARCFAIDGYNPKADKQEECHQISTCKIGSPGQNLYTKAGMTNIIMDINFWKLFVPASFAQWEEVRGAIPEYRREAMIKEYQTVDNETPFSSFTRMVWATTTRIGCSRAEVPSGTAGVIRMVIICNYAGPDENCSTNVLGESVYTPGLPCSICRSNTSCSTVIFPNLCGNLKPVPTDPIGEKKNKGNGCVLEINLWIVLISVIRTVCS